MASSATDGDRLAVARFVFGLANGLDQDLQRCVYQGLVLAQ
jgi:hypothetical protein